MQVATSIQCPSHDRLEWTEVDTRSGEATTQCGQTVHLTEGELLDILLD
jgi:hypothetical protein